MAHWIDVTWREGAWARKYSAQAASINKACADAQATTKGQNDALVKDRDRIAADAANYKRMHPNTCVYPTNTGQLSTGGNQRTEMHGISSDWLRDYAAMCETYRSEVMVCTGQND